MEKNNLKIGELYTLLDPTKVYLVPTKNEPMLPSIMIEEVAELIITKKTQLLLINIVKDGLIENKFWCDFIFKNKKLYTDIRNVGKSYTK